MAATMQEKLAAALLDSELPVPTGVISHTAEVPVKRFAVYRNNVVAGLVGAIEKRFPAIRSIVGEEFFRAMARVYVENHKPRSPLLMTYGDDFPDFLIVFAPVAELPYLPDVARIEAARTRAYHAADASPLAPDCIAALDEEQLAKVRFTLHPSVEIVRSAYPAVTIWAMNSGEREPAEIEHWNGEDALVARDGLSVTVTALPPGSAAFLTALASGLALHAAVEAALADDARFELIPNIAALFESGLVVALTLDSN